MVEIRYDESSGQLKLPKNIRQIGKTQGQTKIYVEDYVITFINRLAQISPMEPKLAILLGYTVRKNDLDYVFIHGAIEAAGVNIQEDHIGFTSGIWSKIYEDIKTYFGDVKVAGWFLTRPGKSLKITEKIRKIHVDNFPGENKALFVIDPLDNDEAFYIYRQGELVLQEGYYIYYERNEEMQNYMIENKNQRESKEMMNTVFLEEEADDNCKAMDGLSGKFSKRALKKASGKLFAQQDGKKADTVVLKDWKKQAKKEGKGKKAKGTYAKTMNKMTRYAAMLVLFVVATAGVAAVRQQNEGTWPVFSSNDSESTDQTESMFASDDSRVKESVDENESKAAETVNTAEGESAASENDLSLADENIAGTQSGEVAVSAGVGTSYRIQEGDTLAAISRRFYNDYRHVEDICRLNGIEDATTIYPGMTILLP